MARPASADVATTAVAAALAVDGVVRTDTGPLGTWVTLGPGRKVDGATVREDDGGRTATLRLVVRWGPLDAPAEAARRAALRALDEAYPGDGPWLVDVEVTDVELPPSPAPDPAPTDPVVSVGAAPSGPVVSGPASSGPVVSGPLPADPISSNPAPTDAALVAPEGGPVVVVVPQ